MKIKRWSINEVCEIGVFFIYVAHPEFTSFRPDSGKFGGILFRTKNRPESVVTHETSTMFVQSKLSTCFFGPRIVSLENLRSVSDLPFDVASRNRCCAWIVQQFVVIHIFITLAED